MSGQKWIASPTLGPWRRSSRRRRRGSRPIASCRRTSSTRSTTRACSACWCRARWAAKKSRRLNSCKPSRKSPRPMPDGVVHRADLGLLHDRQVPEAGNRRGDFQEKSARRAGLGPVRHEAPKRLRKRAAFASPGYGLSPAAAGMPPGSPRIVASMTGTDSCATTPTAIRWKRPLSCRAQRRDHQRRVACHRSQGHRQRHLRIDRCVRAGGSRHRAPCAGSRRAARAGPLYSFTIYQLFGSSFPAVALGIARTTLDAFVALAQNQDSDRQHVAVARQCRDPIAGRRRRSAACRGAGVFPPGLGRRLGRRRNRERCRSTSACGCAWRPFTPASRPGRSSTPPILPPAPPAIFESNPFERRFRDMHAVSQQAAVAFLDFRSDRPAFPRPAAQSAADLSAAARVDTARRRPTMRDKPGLLEA